MKMKMKMNVKYENSTGLVIAAGYMPDMKTSASETIEEVDVEVKTGMVRIGKNRYREATSEEKETAKPQTRKRLDELGKKSVLTNEELTEVLKLNGLL